MKAEAVKTYVNDGSFTCEAVKTYMMKFKENQFGVLEEVADVLDIDKMIDDELSGGGADQILPSQEIHNRAVAYTHDHPDVDYRRAVDIVMEDDPRLVRAYAGEHGTPPRIYTEGATPRDDPSAKLARKAENLVASGVVKNFSEGVRRAIENFV